MFAKITSIMPNHTGKKDPPQWQKVVYFVFPGLTIKSFSFWYGIVFLTFNVMVEVNQRLLTPRLDPSDAKAFITKDCNFLFLGGLIPVFIRYKYQYYRLLVGPFISANITTTLLGFYLIWCYGFLYEKYLSKVELYVTLVLSIILTSLISCFVDFRRNTLTAGGSFSIACWSAIYIFLLWERLDYNIVWKIFDIIFYIVKVVMLLTASLTDFADPISTLLGFIVSLLLGVSFIMTLNKNYDEEKRFLILRGKIFIVIVFFMIGIMCISYITVMYDDMKNYIETSYHYACDKVETTG